MGGMNMQRVLKFDLSPKDIHIKKALNKEFLELDIYAISDIYPNRNESNFTLESMEQSKHSCYNKPILGSFDIIMDDFREHNGQEKYDKEFETTYWDCNGDKDEKILGLIRESDTVEIVSENGHNWLKISCALWTYYTYKQVKKLLKSSTKKVSVEVLIDKYHYDEKGIMIIDLFTLTGITILGDTIREGIPGAHLNVLDLLKDTRYSQQVKCLSFAYSQKDEIDNGIKQDNKMSVLYNNVSLEGKKVTYREKMELLTQSLKAVYVRDDECDCCFWICDFSDSFVVIRDYADDKFYKINYTTDNNAISFDIENKIEQIETFVDAPTAEINGENKTFAEIVEMYQELFSNFTDIEQKYATLNSEHEALNTTYSALNTDFENFKQEYSNKKYSVVIDEVEYNIDEICAKYQSEISEKDSTISDLNGQITEVNEQFNAASNELSDLKEQIKLAAEEKLCKEGCTMVDEEDELDDDDKNDIKEKCKANKYSSIKEVEDDIARCLYAKKKNNRQASFKSNIASNKGTNEEVNAVTSLKNYLNK